MVEAKSDPMNRDVIAKCDTAARDGKASPRKPNVLIFNKSVPSIFDVACLDSARGR